VVKFHPTIIRKEVVILPNIKSAEKRIALSQKQNMRNRQVISELRTKTKTLNAAVKDGADNAQELYTELVGLVDKAWQKGVIHKNKASRKKAQLAKLMSA
jgi:small subunit ribosomal protein S20